MERIFGTIPGRTKVLIPGSFAGLGRRFIPILFLLLLVPALLMAGKDQIPVILEKAEYFLKQGNVMSAREYFIRARSIDKNDAAVKSFADRLDKLIQEQVETHLKEGEYCFSNNEIPKALVHFKAILRFDPNHKEAQSRISEITKLKTQISHFQNHGVTVSGGSSQVFNLNLYSASSAMMRAKSAFDQGDLETALGIVDTILAKEPTYKEAKELRHQIVRRQKFKDMVTGASTKEQGGNFAEAEEFYTQCLVMKPGDLEYLILRGRARMKLERYSDALEDFYEAYDRGAPLDRLRADILKALVGRRDFSRAYGFSGKLSPAVHAEPWSFRVWCYWKTNQYACSFIIILLMGCLIGLTWVGNNLVELADRGMGPFIYKTTVLVGKCMIGKPEQYAVELQKLARYLKHSWVHYLTGILLITVGKRNEAQEQLQAALINPSLAPRAYYFLGLIRSELKEKLSIHDFEQAFLLGLKWHPIPWIPRFLSSLESQLLARTVPQEDTDPIVQLSKRTMKFLIHS